MSAIERLCERATPLGKGRPITRFGWRLAGPSGEVFVVTLPSAEARDNWVKATRVLLEGAGRKLAPAEQEPVAAAAAMTLRHGPFSPAGRHAETLLADYRVRLPLPLVHFWSSDIWTLTPLRFARALGRALDEVIAEGRRPRPTLARLLPPVPAGPALGVTR